MRGQRVLHGLRFMFFGEIQTVFARFEASPQEGDDGRPQAGGVGVEEADVREAGEWGHRVVLLTACQNRAIGV